MKSLAARAPWCLTCRRTTDSCSYRLDFIFISTFISPLSRLYYLIFQPLLLSRCMKHYNVLSSAVFFVLEAIRL